MAAVVQVIDESIILQFDDVSPIVMQVDSGKKLLSYITNLRDWGLYHYGR